ncbi:hypothetical protein HI914_02271 [Erysiphe necator]|nr:hypothetical protein HI914_02271 [Erysiphe necator]
MSISILYSNISDKTYEQRSDPLILPILSVLPIIFVLRIPSNVQSVGRDDHERISQFTTITNVTNMRKKPEL